MMPRGPRLRWSQGLRGRPQWRWKLRLSWRLSLARVGIYSCQVGVNLGLYILPVGQYINEIILSPSFYSSLSPGEPGQPEVVTTRESLNGDRYKCDQCHYKGKHFNSLKQHRKSRHGSEEFVCDSCDYMSRKKNNITHHIIKSMTPTRCQVITKKL